ncbi:MAG: hypothetical protein DRH32_09405 [Deltaproteobacteria bacterium]|nr:MAG: hypothetical protein DRH32_09405 [Deltaproteobacteria bacterium]
MQKHPAKTAAGESICSRPEFNKKFTKDKIPGRLSRDISRITGIDEFFLKKHLMESAGTLYLDP